MFLSKNFILAEFITGDKVPLECVGAYRQLCLEILQPIRDRFEVPVTITSGYRSALHNERIGGKLNSQHVATADSCAADFKLDYDLQVVFDWIRLSSHLPFDQVILERDKETNEPRCIHVSWCRMLPRFAAYEGFTFGGGSYTKVFSAGIDV